MKNTMYAGKSKMYFFVIFFRKKNDSSKIGNNAYPLQKNNNITMIVKR